MLLDDRTFGCGSDSPEITLVSPEVFARKVAIAVEAASNTDCMVLARSYAADQADGLIPQLSKDNPACVAGIFDKLQYLMHFLFRHKAGGSISTLVGVF